MPRTATPSLTNIFQKTEPDAAPKETQHEEKVKETLELAATGRTISIGVGLKEAEVELLDGMSAKFNIARNALIRYGVRYFLAHYLADKVDLGARVEATTKNRLRM